MDAVLGRDTGVGYPAPLAAYRPRCGKATQRPLAQDEYLWEGWPGDAWGKAAGPVKYMLVICDDESDPQGPREITCRPDHVAWIDYMRSSGVKLLGGERLRPSGDATSVRARDGDVLISDGPYAETKEQIGGFALIECADLDQAIEVAARHPFAAHGVIEVRPVWEG